MKSVKALKAVGWLSGSGYQIHIHDHGSDKKSANLKADNVEKPKRTVRTAIVKKS